MKRLLSTLALTALLATSSLAVARDEVKSTSARLNKSVASATPVKSNGAVAPKTVSKPKRDTFTKDVKTLNGQGLKKHHHPDHDQPRPFTDGGIPNPNNPAVAPRPGFTWVPAKGNIPGHWERERAPVKPFTDGGVPNSNNPPYPARPGYVWVPAQGNMPGHWEREPAKPVAAPSKFIAPNHAWIAAKPGMPGHWERKREGVSYEFAYGPDGTTYWVPSGQH